MVERGEIWWTYIGRRRGSNDRKYRPVLVIQSDEFNRSRIGTIICVLITSDLRYVSAPGNVLAPASETGLSRDTVINIAQIVTLDRPQLSELVRLAAPRLVHEVDLGLLESLGLRPTPGIDQAPF